MDFLTCTDMFNPSGWIHQSYSIMPMLLAVRGAGHINSQDSWVFFGSVFAAWYIGNSNNDGALGTVSKVSAAGNNTDKHLGR